MRAFPRRAPVSQTGNAIPPTGAPARRVLGPSRTGMSVDMTKGRGIGTVRPFTGFVSQSPRDVRPLPSRLCQSGSDPDISLSPVAPCGTLNAGRRRRSAIRLGLFVLGNDASAAMRTLPVALLKVGARVGDLFTTVLARYCDLLVFGHAESIRESCPDASSRVREKRN
jgi:hypothetical protein